MFLDRLFFFTLIYTYCDFTDSRSCQETSSPDLCIEYNQFTYVSPLYTKNWYKAYDACHRMGATLAVLDTSHKINLLLDYMRYHPKLKFKDLLYIGLVNQKWIPLSSKSKWMIRLVSIHILYKVMCQVYWYTYIKDLIILTFISINSTLHNYAQ